MSRSGYSDDCDGWDLIRWRGAVNSAIRGKRGQALLRELAEALDAMPIRELVANEFHADGSFCALGVVGQKRGIDVAPLIDAEREKVASTFGIAEALAAEIMAVNDDGGSWGGPYYGQGVKTMDDMRAAERRDRERRWRDVRAWVAEQLKEPAPIAGPHSTREVK